MQIGCIIADAMRRAGFVDVVENFIDWPYGPWMSDKKRHEIGKWSIPAAIDSLATYALGLLTRYLAWKREEVDILCARAVEELRRGRRGERHCIKYYSRV